MVTAKDLYKDEDWLPHLRCILNWSDTLYSVYPWSNRLHVMVLHNYDTEKNI